MDNKTIFTKTAKGVGEAAGKTRALPRDLRMVLKEVDGKATLQELLAKINGLSQAKLHAALSKLSSEDYIREFVTAALETDTLDFSTVLPIPAQTERSPGQRTRIGEALRMQLEARAKAEVDAYERLEREQQERARRGEEELARRKEEERARREAQRKAMIAAQESARQKAEQRARQELEEQARREAEEAAKREAEAQARQEAEEQTRREAEKQARQAAEERARQAAAEKARLQTEAQAKKDADEKIRREAEKQAAKEQEQRMRHEAEEQARRDAEEQARKDAEIEMLRLAQEQAEREAGEARRKAEARAQKEAEEAARRRAEEQARLEAEALEKSEAEQRRKQAAEYRARREAEALAKKEAEEQMQRESEEKARREAEEKSRCEAQALAHKNAEEEIRREFEELEKAQAEEAARKKAEQARRQIEELAQRRAAAKAKKEQEQRARRELERAEAQRADEARAKQEIEQWMREAAEEKARLQGKGIPEPVPEQQAGFSIDGPAEQDDQRDIEQQERKDREAWEEPEVREAEDPHAPEEVERDTGKTSFFNRGEKTYRKPLKWRKPVALGLFSSALLGLGLIHVIPFDGHAALLEKAVAAQFGHPVTIENMHLSLLPQPHWRLGNVSIGAESQITASRITATVPLGSLFGEKAVLKSIELQSPVFNEQALEWLLFARPQQRGFTVERISAIGARLESENISLTPFDVAADIGANGSWERITIHSGDGKTRVQLRPDGDAVQAELNASAFEVPFGSTLMLEEFSAKGTLRRNELAITNFDASVYGGIVAGTATLRWGTDWSLKGDLHAKLIDASQLAPELLQNGKLAGSATYSLHAEQAGGLFAAPRVEGFFSVQNGTLLGVDFAKVLRSANSAGKSSFGEITGTFVREGGKTAIQRLYLNAGLLSVRGNADMDERRNLHGRLAVELKSPTQQARSNLLLTGTLQAPQLTR